MSDLPVPAPTQTVSPTPTTPEEFGRQFLGTLMQMIEDVTTLDVATYITYGEQKGEITLEIGDGRSKYQAVLQAYTRISIDSDTIVLLPGRQDGQEITVRGDLYEIHKQHVEMAMRTRQELLNAMLGAVTSVTNVFKLK